MTERLTEYLRSANVFTEIIHVVPPQSFDASNPSAVSNLGQSQVVDYLLAGEIQHFFGSQSQHTSIFLLPLYFINTFGWQDSKSLPWGKTAVHFTLYDARSGDLVWRRLIEIDRTLPKDTDAMSEAALESFTDAAGILATELRNLPLQPATPSTQ